MPNPPRLTKKQQERFVEHLRENGNVSAAARAVCIARRTPYGQRSRDAEFAKAWDEAIADYIDSLEAEADRRAKDGVLFNVVTDKDGNIIREIYRYSDTLLMFRLNALRPEKYRHKFEGKLDVRGKVDVHHLDDRARKANKQAEAARNGQRSAVHT